MKRYVNKTRFLKRLVLKTNKKTGEVTTLFLKHGDDFSSNDEAVFVDEGIVVRESQKAASVKKQISTEEGKE